MGREPRVDHLLHLRVFRQELRDGHPVDVVLRHPDGERLGPTQHEPRVERAEDRSRRVLHEPQPLDVVIPDGDDDAPDAVAVSVEVFRRAVDAHVGAQFERPLHGGARERVVHDEPCAVRVRDLGRARDVGQAEDRVRGRLDEHHLRARPDRAVDQLRLRRVHVGELERELREDLVEQTERAAVGIVSDHDVIAGAQHAGDGVDRRHARRVREAGLAAFDRRDVRLERRACGILRARVLIALVTAKLFLHVRRRLEDRRDDRARTRIG